MNKAIDMRVRNLIPTPTWAKFQFGAEVRKKSGAAWHGLVVGFYSTPMTPNGYAVMSINEIGSVQIYPEAALELVP